MPWYRNQGNERGTSVCEELYHAEEEMASDREDGAYLAATTKAVDVSQRTD